MRRVVLIGGTLLLIFAATAAYGVVWVDRAIAAVQEEPSAICLTPPYRRQIAAGTLPLAEQDRLVGQTINFATSESSGQTAVWHFKGTAIRVIYGVFWSRDRRRAIFSRVAARMRDCTPTLSPPI